MDQNLLKLIDNWQASYNAWNRGVKHLKEWGKNGGRKNSKGNY